MSRTAAPSSRTVSAAARPRLACPQCSFVHWRNPVPVVAAVVERAEPRGARAQHRPAADWYGLVAGFLERGEHPEAAVLREVAEELGLEGRLVATIGIYPFDRLNQVIFVYHVVVAADGPITLAADELDDYKEVPLEKLQALAPRHGTGRYATGSSRAATIRRSSTSARRSSSSRARRWRASARRLLLRQHVLLLRERKFAELRRAARRLLDGVVRFSPALPLADA